MMQINRKKPNKRIVITLASTLFLALAVALYFLTFNSSTKLTNEADKQPPTTVKSTPDRLHANPHFHDPAANQQGVDGVHTSDESAGAAAFPTTQPNLTIEVTQVHQMKNTLILQTAIKPMADGMCIIEISHLNQLIFTNTTPLAQKEGMSHCNKSTFDITGKPRGEWTLTVKVRVGNNVATTTKLITIQ